MSVSIRSHQDFCCTFQQNDAHFVESKKITTFRHAVFDGNDNAIRKIYSILPQVQFLFECVFIVGGFFSVPMKKCTLHTQLLIELVAAICFNFRGLSVYHQYSLSTSNDDHFRDYNRQSIKCTNTKLLSSRLDLRGRTKEKYA